MVRNISVGVVMVALPRMEGGACIYELSTIVGGSLGMESGWQETITIRIHISHGSTIRNGRRLTTAQ